jgi:TusE/DsrC/DsvC family sulfur relay protein
METMTRMPAFDDQGYLFEPADWTEDLARELARQENIELTERHWEAIRYMRDFFAEHQVIPDVRFVMRHIGARYGGSRNLVFELFPFGYVKQACRIAGMRKPRSWSTG